MEAKAKIVKAVLANGTTVYMQARALGGEEDVAFKIPSFDQVTRAIEGIAESLSSVWEKAKPSKATVEFGVEFAWEAGQVVAMFVEGSTAASLHITLEWGEAPSQ